MTLAHEPKPQGKASSRHPGERVASDGPRDQGRATCFIEEVWTLNDTSKYTSSNNQSGIPTPERSSVITPPSCTRRARRIGGALIDPGKVFRNKKKRILKNHFKKSTP